MPYINFFNNVEENTKFMTGLIPTICVLLKIFKKSWNIQSKFAPIFKWANFFKQIKDILSIHQE